uniref:hypothetical protein n=1 Tax=Oculatella sp. LEGE 06141 TaxID=1828648 RepID=UPI0030DCDC84
MFSGPQFLIALISGVLLAFAIQFLLTNLSVAAGISYLGRSSGDSNSDSSSDGFGETIRKIGVGVGVWTLITVSIALFVACFLAIQLSLLVSPGLGAITGLVIWAAYFSLLVWFSSTTVGSLIGSVVNTATAGFQSIVGTAAAAFGARAVNREVVATAEAAAAAVRHELGTGIDPGSIRESVEDYIQRFRLPELDFSRIRRDFENLLNDPEVAALADNDGLQNIDRQTFVDLVSRRTDFSREEVNRLASLLENTWRQTLGRRKTKDQTSELIDYLRSAQPGQVRYDELNAKLDRVIEENRRLRETQTKQADQSESGGGMQSTVQSGLLTLTSLLMGRSDLSDVNIERILERIKMAQGVVSGQADKYLSAAKGEEPRQSYSTVRADIENYLLNAYSWQMTPQSLDREFQNVLYDAEADPASVHRQLMEINRADFVDILTSRGLFTQDEINRLADQMEKIRRDVLAVARGAEEREAAFDLRRRVETYLTLTPKEQLLTTQTDGTLSGFKALLENQDVDYDTMSLRLTTYDRESLRQVLAQRQDLTPTEAETILNALEATRNQVLHESQALDQQLKQRADDLQQRVEGYLRSTGKDELNPEGIKRDLQMMLSDPQTGLAALRYRASNFDRETFVQLLKQRGDTSDEEANRLVDQVQSNWNAVSNSPQILASMAKERYDQTTTAIADYLRRTNLEELNPAGIQRDLRVLLDDPKEGTIALRRRLSHVDRETLVRLLSQRGDLTEDQINRYIDQLEDAIRQIVKAPRRMALRTKQAVVDFESSLEEYLRNTNKAELNPEGIKRDLQLLMQNPKAGMGNLGDRLSQVDRSTVVALLAQRPDMSPEEAEHAVAQFESVRDQILDQFRQVQYRIQGAIDSVFDRIRDYLNSLERPELNYEGIKRDIRTLFDDPQAGFEALRSRLSQFDRDTLVAVISSRPDISEADANRMINQIEGARNSVLQRAERIQTEAQRRVEEVKRQAQRQAEETRKAAAAASWWLFATALVSATTSAIAGALSALA